MDSMLLPLFAIFFRVHITAAARITHRSRAETQHNSVAEGARAERKKMDLNIGQCIHPENPSILTYSSRGEKKWYATWDELVWDKMDDTKDTVDAWGNHPFGNANMPWHMLIGLFQNSDKYPAEPPPHGNVGLDSECFIFDYDNNSAPDRAGCRPFAASFRPLQKLRSCIVEHLDNDTIWTSRYNARLPSEDGNQMLDYASWCKQSVWATLDYPFTGIVGGVEMVKNVLCNPVFDSKRRALEMIKFVLYKLDQLKPNTDANFKDLLKAVIQKIHFTVTWQRGEESLTASTASSIAKQCFHIQEGSSNTPDVGSLSLAARLWSIRKCLPVMFDKAEIAGHGVSDAIVKFQANPQGIPGLMAALPPKFEYAYYGNPEQELHQMFQMPVAPLCGRLALASIPNFADANYEIATFETLGNDRFPAFFRCLDVRSTNCRKAYFCWESALNRVCGMHPKCCPGNASTAEETHESCANNPDGKLINIGSTRLLPTGEMFGRKGHCRTVMGTGN